jgi:hypothetical protein
VTITPRPASVGDLVGPGPPRSDGLHVSRVIKSLLLAIDPERFSGDMNWEKIEFGFTVEAMIEQAFRDRRQTILRIGELHKDGLAGSPDGVSFDLLTPGHDTMVIHEFKCTWMSSRGCPEDRKFWHWIVQMKCYCHMAGTPHARLHVFFVNGNYREQRDPQYCEWDLTFTEGELEENWMMIINAAAALREPDGTHLAG